jgi:hypothetical protein
VSLVSKRRLFLLGQVHYCPSAVSSWYSSLAHCSSHSTVYLPVGNQIYMVEIFCQLSCRRYGSQSTKLVSDLRVCCVGLYSKATGGVLCCVLCWRALLLCMCVPVCRCCGCRCARYIRVSLACASTRPSPYALYYGYDS